MVDLLVVLLRVVEGIQGVSVRVDCRVAVLELVVEGLVMKWCVLVISGEIRRSKLGASGGVS